MLLKKFEFQITYKLILLALHFKMAILPACHVFIGLHLSFFLFIYMERTQILGLFMCFEVF